MYRFILIHSITHTGTYQDIIQCHGTGTYQYIPVHTRQVHTRMYQYILVYTYPDLSSRMVQTRFESEIVCILFACKTAALQEYRHQTLDMLQMK